MKHEELIKLICSHGGNDNIIVTPRILVDLAGGDTTLAMMLSQLIYWSNKASREDGYVYKSVNDWKREIGAASTYIVDKLKKLPYIETKLVKANGAPTTHYKIDFDVLFAEIDKLSSGQGDYVGDNARESVLSTLDDDLQKSEDGFPNIDKSEGDLQKSDNGFTNISGGDFEKFDRDIQKFANGFPNIDKSLTDTTTDTTHILRVNTRAGVSGLPKNSDSVLTEKALTDEIREAITNVVKTLEIGLQPEAVREYAENIAKTIEDGLKPEAIREYASGVVQALESGLQDRISATPTRETEVIKAEAPGNQVSTSADPPAGAGGQGRQWLAEKLPQTDAKRGGDMLDGMIAYQPAAPVLDLSDYPEQAREVIGRFYALWKIPPPSKVGDLSGYKLWVKEAREVIDACAEFGLPLMDKYYKRWVDDGRKLSITRLGSIKNMLIAEAGMARQEKSKPEDKPKTPEEIREFWEKAKRRTAADTDYEKTLEKASAKDGEVSKLQDWARKLGMSTREVAELIRYNQEREEMKKQRVSANA